MTSPALQAAAILRDGQECARLAREAWDNGTNDREYVKEVCNAVDEALALITAEQAKPAHALPQQTADKLSAFADAVSAISPGDHIANLRSALQRFANIRADDGDTFSAYPRGMMIRCEVTVDDILTAREVLSQWPELAP